jgi:DNA-binding PadR family transcriptional regulator
MTIAHTILVELNKSPYTGYDLSKKFAKSSCYFWKASHQQIYRELAVLEDKGLISGSAIYRDRRPYKKLYEITKIGQEKLTQWLAQSSDPTPVREDLMVKLTVAYLVPRAVILQELKRHRQIHLQQLSTYQNKMNRDDRSCQRSPLEKQCADLTSRWVIRQERSWIAWCDEAIELLSQNLLENDSS